MSTVSYFNLHHVLNLQYVHNVTFLQLSCIFWPRGYFLNVTLLQLFQGVKGQISFPTMAMGWPVLLVDPVREIWIQHQRWHDGSSSLMHRGARSQATHNKSHLMTWTRRAGRGPHSLIVHLLIRRATNFWFSPPLTGMGIHYLITWPACVMWRWPLSQAGFEARHCSLVLGPTVSRVSSCPVIGWAGGEAENMDHYVAFLGKVSLHSVSRRWFTPTVSFRESKSTFSVLSLQDGVRHWTCRWPKKTFFP